jgi:hypothetical protein
MNEYLPKIREYLIHHPLAFRAWKATLTGFGRVVNPFLSPLITRDQIGLCYSILDKHKCAVLGVYSRRYATGHLLPLGKYGVEHTAWYLGSGQVLEAVTPRVRIIPLSQFLKPYDRIVIGFLNLPSVENAFNRALQLNGRSYDVLFDSKVVQQKGIQKIVGSRMPYCHETVAICEAGGGLLPNKSGEYWVADDVYEPCYAIHEVLPTRVIDLK